MWGGMSIDLDAVPSLNVDPDLYDRLLFRGPVGWDVDKATDDQFAFPSRAVGLPDDDHFIELRGTGQPSTMAYYGMDVPYVLQEYEAGKWVTLGWNIPNTSTVDAAGKNFVSRCFLLSQRDGTFQQLTSNSDANAFREADLPFNWRLMHDWAGALCNPSDDPRGNLVGIAPTRAADYDALIPVADISRNLYIWTGMTLGVPFHA